MKKTFTLLLLSSLSLFANAQKAIDVQDQNGVKKYFGVDQRQLMPKEWKANWIWRRGETFASNVMLCARKTFTLKQKPETSRLYITGDSHYSLWVNGQFIGRGPARSAAHHQSFDVLDIASKLETGKNVIAIKVHHTDYTQSYGDKPRPGLLFQLEIPQADNPIIITSNTEVKVRNENGWDTETPQVDGSNTTRVENFDFRKSELNWEQPDFDDSDWENAVLLKQDWWPPKKNNIKDFARMAPWHTLVPRDIPYLEETMQPVKKVFETGECDEFTLVGKGGTVEHMPVLGVVQRQILPLKHCKIQGLDNFLQQKGELVITNYRPKTLYNNEPFRSTWIVFDMGETLEGYPSLDVDAPKGTNVDITYATVLLDGKFNPALIADNWGDRITLSGKKTVWNAQELHTFRYIGFLVTGTDKPVTISWAGLRRTIYPFKDSAAPKLGDDMLDKLAEASRKTIKIITSDSYNDNYRERRQYIQTAFYSARGNYALFGDPYLMRRCLTQIAQDQLPDGFLPMHAPGKPKAGILEADLMWHMSLYDYYMYSGDAVTVKSLLEPLKRDLAALESIENPNGLFENPSHPYWIDHADIDRRGINFTLNGWYVIALENDARLFKYFGEGQMAAKCLQKADQIKQYLKTKFWNAEKGLFAETEINGRQTGLYDEITNGVALITGIANATQAKSIASKILHNDQTQEMERPTVMMFWPIEGLFKAGYGKEAIKTLKSRYAVMLQHPNGTLWEGWNLYTYNQSGAVFAKTRTSAQAEQTFHPDIFNRNLIGVEVLKPGMKEVQITYHDNGLEHMESVIPSPYGNITVKWELNGKANQLHITYPKAIKVVLNKHSFPAGTKVMVTPG